jgi:hypothetical protein
MNLDSAISRRVDSPSAQCWEYAREVVVIRLISQKLKPESVVRLRLFD